MEVAKLQTPTAGPAARPYHRSAEDGKVGPGGSPGRTHDPQERITPQVMTRSLPPPTCSCAPPPLSRRSAARRCRLIAAAAMAIVVWSGVSVAAIHVSPSGDDAAAGTSGSPFRTIHRARDAARDAAKDMRGDVVVSLAPGEYRLDRTLEFTEADSGRNGFRVVYRSAAGPGKARLLGSVPVTGWTEQRNGIWKAALPTGTVFHTLYENGRRLQKARFPNLETDPDMPVALGRYLVSADGSPVRTDKAVPPVKTPGWLQYPPGNDPPDADLTKVRLHIYGGGKCDWVREIRQVTSIDRAVRRIEFTPDTWRGIGVGARFFLEDALGFLDAPGEFFVDTAANVLYLKPAGRGHPDRMDITRPVLSRMIQVRGSSRDACASDIVFDGLALEETDNSPPEASWAYAGLTDGAMVWLNNATRIEVRRCHLKNGGRSGVMMIGHNIGNIVDGCWIEHMGLNGVSLCNRFSAPGGKTPTMDRCESNRVHNTRISHVGELHSYAECITAFNVASNDVGHCELSHSVRYAVTVRGNTGTQYGPPVTTPHPACRGNRFHHLRIWRCGQDGGDMGALHCAALNNPGDGSVNVFEQITVADTAAIASMKDIAPDGIFLDWPKMSVEQVFRNVQIVRSQGLQLRSHGPDNGDSAVTENVSWKPGFEEKGMDYASIGLTADFPAEFGGRPASVPDAAAPGRFRARAVAHNRVDLEWRSVVKTGVAEFRIERDGRVMDRTAGTRWRDTTVGEGTSYVYRVSARSGDFGRFGPAAECKAVTPPDRTPPAVTGARMSSDGRRVRVAFDEPVDPVSAVIVANYGFDPSVTVRSAELASPSTVVLGVEGLASNVAYRLSVVDVADRAVAANRRTVGMSIAVGGDDLAVRYDPVADAPAGRLRDTSGGGGDAVLQGGAVVEAGIGPSGGAALRFDGKQAFAVGPDDLNLGPGDFTLAVRVWREGGGVIVSKGNGFGRPDQWSFGLAKAGVPGSVSLRINNVFLATGERAMKDRQWTHLTFVRCGSEGRWYVDGRSSGEPHDMSGIGPLVNDRPLRIGRREYEPDPMWFNGRVAGLTLWRRALTAEEILDAARGCGVDRSGGE